MDTGQTPFRDPFRGHGYRVFRNVIPPDQIQGAVDAICSFLGVDLAKPESWYQTPPENAGIVPLHHASALWENRQSLGVYEAFQEIYGHGRLWVSMDRSGFRPPMRKGLEAPQEDGWHRSLGNIHWDADPRKPHPGFVQGVLLLSKTPPNAGGFQCVPEIYNDLPRWLGKHPGLDPSKPDIQGCEVVQVSGEAGDLIVWDPFLPHGPGSNFSRGPRIAQYITMVPEMAANNPRANEERTNRIQLFEQRRAPEWWRGLAGQQDPESHQEISLTPLGRKLVGIDPWKP